MARGDSLDRTLRILQILSSSRNGLTVKEVHDRATQFHEIEERTVRRDLEILEGSGIGVTRINARDPDGRRTARYKVDASVSVAKSFSLQPNELLALYIARGMLKPLAETLFYRDLDRFFKRIEALFDARTRKHLDELGSSIHFEAGPKWALGVTPDILDTVKAACEEGHVLKFHYEGANGKPARDRTVGPHFLYFSKGALYLVAEDLEAPEHGAPKTFALPRMTRAEMRETPYEGKRSDPAQVFAKSFGVFRSETAEKIRVRFERQAASYVRERRWHDSQRVISLPDGRIELHLEAGLTPDLIQWVLGFGAAAQILEPVELRTCITHELRKTLAIYETETDSDQKPRSGRLRVRTGTRKTGKTLRTRPVASELADKK